MQSALDLLQHGEVCKIVVGKLVYEAIWSATARCWFTYDLRGPHTYTPEDVDEWMPVVVKS